MTRAQAKDVLAACRPGRDDREPLFIEALAFARQDAELQSWFEEQQLLDESIRAKLQQAAAPPRLLEQIHAGVAARHAHAWRKWWPLAACLVVLGLLAGVWLNRDHEPAGSLARCRSDLATWLKTFPALEVQTGKAAEMRQWLADRHGLPGVELPGKLATFPGIGCRTVQWRDKQLALLCFMVDGEVVHLFVLRASEFPADRLAAVPQMTASGGFTCAAWRQGQFAYLALTRGDESFLRTHL